MKRKSVTEFRVNGFFRDYLLRKGFKTVPSINTNEEYFVNDKGHQVTIYWGYNKGVKFINKYGFTLFKSLTVTDEDFNLFNKYNVTKKRYPDN
jgi:hypothetical protein